MPRICLLLFSLIVFSTQGFALSSDSDRISPDHAAVSMSPNTILDRLEDTMSGIRDLKADMAFRILIKKLGFPFTVHADYYFKTPDKVRIKLRGIPGLLAGDVPKTVTAATTLTGFRKDLQSLYHAKLQGVRSFNHQSCYQLELTPIKEDGNVSKTVLWINRENYTIPQLITQYKDGSWVEVKRTYAKFEGHLLVSHIDATMNFVQSDLEASVKAEYSGYKLNQGLSDSLFDEKKG